jgi:chromosome partitioning protein
MKIISFINFKGGVGKTTLCVEVATSLVHKYKKRVLLIDLDPQTNATFFLMEVETWRNHSDKQGTLRDFFNSCLSDKNKAFRLDDIIVKHPVQYKEDYLEGLDLIPSHIELFGMDLELATRFGHSNLKAKLFLKKALEQVKDNYDYVLIDCPPNLYLATQNGLFASQNYIIVALAEYLSTIGIARIQKLINGIFLGVQELLEDAGLFDTTTLAVPELSGIIFNRVWRSGSGTKSQEKMMGEIREKYPQQVFKDFIPQSDRIATRAEKHTPIALSDSAEDQDYQERIHLVAKELYDRLK